MASFNDYMVDAGRQFDNNGWTDWFRSKIDPQDKLNLFYNIAQQRFQNEYNSPEEQMKRFIAAGLNPNLIYDKVNNTPSAGTNMHFTSQDRQIQKTQMWLSLLGQVGGLIKDAGTFAQGIQNLRIGEQDLWYKTMQNRAFGKDAEHFVTATLNEIYPEMEYTSRGIYRYNGEPGNVPPGFVNLYGNYYVNHNDFNNPFKAEFYRKLQSTYANADAMGLLNQLREKQYDYQNEAFQRLKYNNEFLNQLTPTQRMFMEVLQTLLGTIFDGVKTFK